MSEYKENTVGWQLSQLKEPLKSRALEDCDPHLLKEFGYDSIFKALRAVWLSTRVRKGFWIGAMMYWISVCKEHQFLVEEEECKRDRCDDKAKEGWDMAKECAPDNWLKPKDGGEDKAIVDSPEKPESWVDAEIRKYRDNIEKVLTFDAVSPTPEISNMEDLGSLADFHFPKIVKSDALPPNHFVGIGDDGNPFIGKLSTSIIPPTWEIEAPQRAVVGYEEPKPIDTIEKKHELKIQNLELAKYHQGKEIENLQARVEQLEGVVGKLEQQIEYVYRNLPKDFDGTR